MGFGQTTGVPALACGVIMTLSRRGQVTLASYYARVAGMAPPGMLAWLHSPRPGATAMS
jgi:hypothetical protein